jgi:GTP pyrophosphokinase
MEDREIFRKYLRQRCALLDQARPGDERAIEIARQVWAHDAVEAEKLGEMELRARAEDSAMRFLEPGSFESVTRGLATMIGDRGEWRSEIIKHLKACLKDSGVRVVAIQNRAKHTAGVWRKMHEKRLKLDEVTDLLAFRIIVPSEEDCYLALETIHSLFEPEPFRFKDYIVDPKANGYQSLHTSVRDQDGFSFEVQIRTVEMHRAAEEGLAAHWRYRVSKGPGVSPLRI